jgi:hypothetical protein
MKNVDQNLRDLENENKAKKKHAKEVQDVIKQIDNDIAKERITERGGGPEPSPIKPQVAKSNVEIPQEKERDPEPLDIKITDPTPDKYVRKETRKRPVHSTWKVDHTMATPKFDDLSTQVVKTELSDVKKEPTLESEESSGAAKGKTSLFKKRKITPKLASSG